MNEKKPASPWVKNLLIWVAIVFGLLLYVQMIGGTSRTTSGQAIAYSDFVRQVDQGNVRSVTITNDSGLGPAVITGRLADGGEFRTIAPADAKVSDKLVERASMFRRSRRRAPASGS
jgi:cell division protease FtsH